MKKKAIIIGAGPAGLTAAYELLKRTDILPVILEKSGDIGGISKTINYKGNRMDMGPHRFFSKSDRVMDWWLNIMPLETNGQQNPTIHYHHKSRVIPAVDHRTTTPGEGANKMLLIKRLTRIYFLRKFFAYPIQLSFDTLKTLGLVRTIKIMCSFLWIRLFPRKPEKSLEDFIINKFGRQLYLLFFKDYTEKVWGVPCHEISAEWGAQRIKGVSLSKALAEAVKNLRKKKNKATDINQKGTETSLIEQFLYPKYGPGSLWEEVARQVKEMGGRIYLNQSVQHIHFENNQIVAVNTINNETGQTGAWEGDYFFSSMPVQELVAGMGDAVPNEVKEVAAGLQYRDFINVGILLKQLSQQRGNGEYEKLELKDNWIYIQDRDVKVGRLMIYNNWGGGMIKDPSTTWIGMEYFCNKTDKFWGLPDKAIEQFAIEELEKMQMAKVEDVLDSTVQRMEKTYPAYFGTYDRFETIQNYVDQFDNLYLVGRNGMHKYNNADHSMLTAMVSVDNIAAGITSKENIWAINTEQEYHEEKHKAGSTKSEVGGQKSEVPAGVQTETGVGRKTEQEVLEPVSEAAITGAPLGHGGKNGTWLNFLWHNKWNRRYIGFAVFAYIVQFILFKLYYPFANYMPDSYSYLEAAAVNADVNMWPVAYSKFLRLFSVFTHSDYLLTGFQYLFMSLSGLAFVFTLTYFFKPNKWVKLVLLAFFIFNPIALYVSNYIAADALFIALSLVWITQLLWIIYQPKPWMILTQAFLLLAVFTVRYNAIYYPLIAGLAFLLSKQKIRMKLAGIGLGAALIFCSVWYTSNKMEEVTGKQQFSAFGGWQLANNALYMYETIPDAERKPVPQRFAALENMVQQHFDTLARVQLTRQDSASGYFYLWSEKGPLKKYMHSQYEKDTTTPGFKRWASVAPLYTDYALYLMKQYPAAFLNKFLLPNAMKFAVPPPEFLGIYNMGGDSVGVLAKTWFNYDSQKVANNNSKEAKIITAEIYPVATAVINALLIICVAGFLLFNGFKQADNGLQKTLLLVLLLWILNTGFSIFASPIVLRYQVFPMLVSFALAVLAAEMIYKLGLQQEVNNKNKLQYDH